MAKHNVIFTKDNEYYTPKEFVRQFGNFDYDPATTPEKAAEFNIKHYDTIESNGLNSHWENYQRIWCNPPFTIKHLFLKKAVETIEKKPKDYNYVFSSDRIFNNKKISSNYTKSWLCRVYT